MYLFMLQDHAFYGLFMPDLTTFVIKHQTARWDKFDKTCHRHLCKNTSIYITDIYITQQKGTNEFFRASVYCKAAVLSP